MDCLFWCLPRVGCLKQEKKSMYPLSIVKNKIKLVKEFSVNNYDISEKFSVIAGIVEAQTRKKGFENKTKEKRLDK